MSGTSCGRPCRTIAGELAKIGIASFCQRTVRRRFRGRPRNRQGKSSSRRGRSRSGRGRQGCSRFGEPPDLLAQRQCPVRFGLNGIEAEQALQQSKRPCCSPQSSSPGVRALDFRRGESLCGDDGRDGGSGAAARPSRAGPAGNRFERRKACCAHVRAPPVGRPPQRLPRRLEPADHRFSGRFPSE